MDVDVNYWAVLLAAVSSMIVGSIWYSQSAFGPMWGKMTGVNMDRRPKPSEMARLLGLTFLASLITAYVLAHVSFLANKFFGNSFFYDSVSTAFWVWLGFTACRMLTHDLFEGRRRRLTTLNIAHELVTFLVMGVVIGWLHP